MGFYSDYTNARAKLNSGRTLSDSSKKILEELQAKQQAEEEKKRKEEEEKKKAEESKGWFKSSDGNFWEAVGGTLSKAGESVGAGLLGLGETLLDGVVSAAPYFAKGQYYANGGGYNLQNDAVFEQRNDSEKQWSADFVAKDLYDEKQLAKDLNPVRYTGFDVDGNSVLGAKSEALLQSAGQLAGQVGLQAVGIPWFVTTGVSSLGSETESALNQGATMDQAVLSGTISAGADILTEKLFGGDLFTSKAGLDDAIDALTKGISQKFVAKLTNWGLNAAGEGVEEWVSQRIGQFGQWLAYQHDEKSLMETLYSEEALEEAIDSFVGGTILGGGQGAIKIATQSGKTAQDIQTDVQNGDTAANEEAASAKKSGAEDTQDALGRVQSILELGKSTDSQSKTGTESKPSVMDAFEQTLKLGSNAPADPVAAAVDGFRQTGTVTNKQATDILMDSKAVEALQTEGLDLKNANTASARREAIKNAVAALAQKQAAVDSAEQNAELDTEAQKNAVSEETTVDNRQSGKEHISMVDFTSQDSSVWNNVDYNDNATKAKITKQTHDSMVAEGAVVNVSNTVLDTVSQAYPDLRNVKKKERTPILKATMSKLKNDIRQFLNGFKNQSFEFEVDGKVLEARLYSTGINEVLEKVTQEKASMLYTTEDIFRNARYLYSTQDYDGDPNVYRWNYFYTPIQIGNETVGVRIAVRDLAKQGESQIYNWGIKKDTSLGGVRGDLNSRKPHGASSDVSTNTIPQSGGNVNTKTAETESVGAAPAGFDRNSHLQYQYGTLPEGENAVRSDDLPASTDGTNRVSQTAVTVKGAKVTPDEFADLLTKDVTEKNGMTYIPITNDATVQKAIENITNEGWEAAKGQWQANVRAGKTGADMSATGALLLNNAAKAGDTTAWLDILHDYQLMGTNTAQGLQALRILKKLSPSDKLYMVKRSVKQMAQDMHLDTKITIDAELEAEYQNAKTDEARDAALKKIQKDVASQIPSTLMEKFTALRYVNMLGNLRTQGRNIAGNLSMKAVRSVQNTIAASLESIASKASGGKLQRTRSATVSREQKAAAAKDFDSVKTVILDGGKYSDSRQDSSEFAKGVQDERQIFKNKALEGYRKVTNWAMEQGDLIFAKDAYARALAGYLKAQGITETDYAKIDTAVLDDARLFAAKEAQEATFRDTNWLSGWVSKVGRRKDTPAAVKVISEGIMPFRKTPANVLVRAEEYSPLGVFNSLYYSAKATKNGSNVTGAQVINSWAKTLTGTGIFGLGMLLQSLGLLSAGPDEDEDKEAFEETNGWQNYALTLPDGTNITLDWMSPAAMPLLMGAQLSHLMGEEDLTVKDLEAALTSIADPMVEMSMLQGVNDTLENIQYADDDTLGQLLINAGLSYLTQGLTNTLAGQLERTFEDSRMQTYVDKNSDLPAWLQRFLGKNSAKTPGLDYNQIPYINAWGEEEENPGTGLNTIYQTLSPAYIDKGKDDPLTRELNRLNDAQSDVNVYPRDHRKEISYRDENDELVTKTLTAEEYVTLAKAQGQQSKALVEEIIGMDDYKALPDETKAKIISRAYDVVAAMSKSAVVDYHEEPAYITNRAKGMSIAEAILRQEVYGSTSKYTSLSVSDASGVMELLDSLLAESGYTNVRGIQRIEAIVGADDLLTEEEQEAVLKDTLDDSAWGKYQQVLALGLDNDDYAASYRLYLDTSGDGKKAKTIAQYQKEFGISYSEAKALYEIYNPAR